MRSRSKIFLLYNNEDISSYIHPDIIPLKLNQTHYFESEAFRMLNESDLPDVENIGFITPSSRFKIPNFSIEKILQLEPNPIVFLNTLNATCEAQAVRGHGDGFLIIWKYLLDCHSISHNIINTYKISSANLWIAKKSFVIEYLKFAKKSIQYLDNPPANIKSILWSNSGYKGKLLNTGLLEKKFNVSHYPFHPFIMERAICLYTKHISNITSIANVTPKDYYLVKKK